MSDETNSPARWRVGDGTPGPGRPKGARNKLSEAFIQALHDDFAEHGAAAIATVRETKPDQYLKVIASLLPRDVNLSVVDEAADLTDDELRDRIRWLTDKVGALLGDDGASSLH